MTKKSNRLNFKVINIFLRMEYFGYRVEPFNMKADRESGVIHEDGFVEIKKGKERKDRHGVILYF